MSLLIYFFLHLFQVEHWNLERYVDMALDAKWKEDLDFAQVSHIRNATRQIRQPMIPIESFNPNSTYRPSFSNRVSFKVNNTKLNFRKKKEIL